MTKAPIPLENKSQERTHRHHEKTSITERLSTDLRRSVGGTTVIQVVWLKQCT